MSQTSFEQFNSGFFTMSGAATALALVYPVYYTSKVLCTRFFQRNNCVYNKCDC